MQSFQLFKLLPVELRLQIWALNLSGPRLVKVYYNLQTGKFYTTTSSPANLLVCKELRWEILDQWTLQVGTASHPPLIRVNLAIDTVQLDWDPLRLRAVSQPDLSSIVSLELGGRELQQAGAKAILDCVLSMNSLQDLSIVSPPPTVLRHSSLDQPFRLLSVEPGEEEPWLVMAERLGNEERRNQAFHQHMNLTRCFRAWAREHPDHRLPKLRLLLIETDGSRSGRFFWKP
jgi:hypothetical protein